MQPHLNISSWPRKGYVTGVTGRKDTLLPQSCTTRTQLRWLSRAGHQQNLGRFHNSQSANKRRNKPEARAADSRAFFKCQLEFDAVYSDYLRKAVFAFRQVRDQNASDYIGTLAQSTNFEQFVSIG